MASPVAAMNSSERLRADSGSTDLKTDPQWHVMTSDMTLAV